MTLRVLDGAYAIARLDPDAALPDWADGSGFVSIARSAEELSILCRADRVPATIRADAGWRGFQFLGPFAFDQTGIAAAVLTPLATAKIAVLLIATFDTDYLFVKIENAGRAAEILTASGHVVAAAA
ncbi:ACT domain-containing protein [Jiella flava]|uniref:ACT domain-containing protein n=1 Tax=Jiella flava TaxID=2816857 RepID=UPI0031B8114B